MENSKENNQVGIWEVRVAFLITEERMDYVLTTMMLTQLAGNCFKVGLLLYVLPTPPNPRRIKDLEVKTKMIK